MKDVAERVLAELLAGRTVVCDSGDVDDAGLTIRLRTTVPVVTCPMCGTPTDRVHSRYDRRVADLAWGARPVALRVRVRRCFCRPPTCGRRVFAERLGAVAAARGRRSARRIEVERVVGLALGGAAGARLLAHLRLSASDATLLRRVRRALDPAG